MSYTDRTEDTKFLTSERHIRVIWLALAKLGLQAIQEEDRGSPLENSI